MAGWVITTEAQFLALYDATVADAHRYASRLAGSDRTKAEDLVQDVYLELLHRVKAGTLTEVGLGWIIVAIRHRFLDGIRSTDREDRRLRLVWARPNVDAADDQFGDPLAAVRLNDRERAALTMRYVDGLSVPEVAAALGATVRATESLLSRAKTRVRASEVRNA
jgi:RNA polymerase sigma-70 factor (ECF subfamily)